MTDYKVTYNLDSDGWWVASVSSVPGCYSQGRSIGQARNRVRQALGLFIKDADNAALLDDIRMPKQIKSAIAKAKSARHKADQEQMRAKRLIYDAALTLVKKFNLSRRDAAEILGLSHQRVHQLLDEAIQC